MLQSPPGTIGGYLLRSSSSTSASFGGLAGADAACLTDVTANNWVGKATASANGQLIAAKVKAFMCDNTTCNNLTANTVYAFARSGSLSAGGMWMTTDASGRGPNDNAAWQAYNYWNAGSSFWSGYRDTVSNTVWATTVNAATTTSHNCNNWTNNTVGVTGAKGNATATNNSRWYNASLVTCDGPYYLACMVNP